MTVREALAAGQAFVIDTDGSIQQLGERPDLTDIQRVIGGYVQMVPSTVRPKSWRMLVDEDGLYRKLAVNPTATQLCAIPGAVIVGKAVLTRYV